MIMLWFICTIMHFIFMNNLCLYSIMFHKDKSIQCYFRMFLDLSQYIRLPSGFKSFSILALFYFTSMCMVVNRQLVNPYLTQNTKGYIYPYINSSIILLHQISVYPNTGLLNYLPLAQRLLIYVCSVVQCATHATPKSPWVTTQHMCDGIQYIMTL